MSFLDKLFKKKESVENKAKDAANKAENAAKDAAAKVDNAAKNVAAKVDSAVKGAAEDAKQTVAPGTVEKVIHEPKFADLGELLPGAPAGGKINLAIYWAAACGGCDVSVLDVNERILTIGDMANIVMWPVAADGKEKDIAAMEDGEITLTLISGAVRNSENEHMVRLLRQKSKILVASVTLRKIS